jgi:hypothetical protein
MQVQVNSDRSVNVDDEFSQLVEMTVNKSLARFDGRITRVEVHLSDVNSGKFGSDDKRCLMEARPAGRDPVAVTNEAATLEELVRGASDKLRRLLSSLFGRLGEKS